MEQIAALVWAGELALLEGGDEGSARSPGEHGNSCSRRLLLRRSYPARSILRASDFFRNLVIATPPGGHPPASAMAHGRNPPHAAEGRDGGDDPPSSAAGSACVSPCAIGTAASLESLAETGGDQALGLDIPLAVAGADGGAFHSVDAASQFRRARFT